MRGRRPIEDIFIDKKILAMLEAGKTINGEMIVDLLESHFPVAKMMMDKYDRYQQRHLAIQERTFEDPTKLNNKLANDFRSAIIDQSVGYMFGTPIAYGVNELNYNEREYQAIMDRINRFVTLSNIQDMDAETGKVCAICGRAYRLCYINEEGEEAIEELMPWEVVTIKDKNRVKYALRHYIDYDGEGNEYRKVEWYDDRYIYTFIEHNEGYKLNEDPKEHLFQFCPVVEFENNKECMGDFDKVESLIDAYDRLVSDNQNELEEFRQAYMVFDGGAELEKEDVIRARQTGAFSVPDGCKPYFLTKSINNTFNEEQKNLLEENIYKFSKSVNMSDEKFSGTEQSGESRKWKLIDLENKAIVKERKYSKALRDMFRILCSAWNIKGINLDYLDVYFTFTRTLPIDLSYYGEVAGKLKGILADKTILELMPMVDDVDYELELQAKEAEEAIEKQMNNMMSFGGVQQPQEEEEDQDNNNDYQFGGGDE